MEPFFPHEKLEVYTKALAAADLASSVLDSWPVGVAVRDQLDRAVESMVTNLVNAARWQRTDRGTYCLECSLGSVLECAACHDVALRRGLIKSDEVDEAKRLLQQVARMEVGLRRSWTEPTTVKEDGASYGADAPPFFAHESLVAYQRSLQVHDALGSWLCDRRRRLRYGKRIDELSTSLTINIAEGNGRFQAFDQGTFVTIAEEAATKLAAYLDLAATAWMADMSRSKQLLRETMAMLVGLNRSLDGEGLGDEGRRRRKTK